MKQSEINFKVTLDDNNLPEKIDWRRRRTKFKQSGDDRFMGCQRK